MIHPISRAALAIPLIAAIGGSARATTLETAPAPAFFANDAVVYCQMRNVGPKPMSVIIEAVAFEGTVLNSLATTVAPNQAVGHLGGGATSSCRFNFDGTGRNVRALALYWDGTDYSLALPAR